MLSKLPSILSGSVGILVSGRRALRSLTFRGELELPSLELGHSYDRVQEKRKWIWIATQRISCLQASHRTSGIDYRMT